MEKDIDISVGIDAALPAIAHHLILAKPGGAHQLNRVIRHDLGLDANFFPHLLDGLRGQQRQGSIARGKLQFHRLAILRKQLLRLGRIVFRITLDLLMRSQTTAEGRGRHLGQTLVDHLVEGVAVNGMGQRLTYPQVRDIRLRHVDHHEG